jgi:GMP synthase-like glutamine amidotransferase
MNIHYLQHVPFEGLGSVEPVLLSRGHRLTATRLYAGENLPAVSDFDWLIVMGGPMGIYDDDDYPWLAQERTFIKQVIDAGNIVLGICLGAQLIADALGGQVFRNRHREIGWFPIFRSQSVGRTIMDGVLPDRMDVFHWHGDTFDLPADCLPVASSEACVNQGFVYENRVIALQFHLETTCETAQALIDNCGNELDGSRFVQPENELLADPARFDQINHVMQRLLEKIENSEC